ncbi:ROK family glucokinase [Ornithinimicrobium faecis]|uniref:Glucokinase n=1 Tax=Ornithinimicrobium faecis TaxID=2934158 RepID=A0ABY4YZX5_9MICO|nr:ROK family glucokinase [Ornithinimicrobium sp. HY1793]USQ81672.1 ROK family glucokinase [Ornithinimicrobium sp. HY1793]
MVTEQALTIGVDVGGTKVVAGLVDESGSVVAQTRRDTPGRTTQPSVVEEVIVDAVAEMLAAATGPVLGVGLGAAGFVSADRRTVVFAPHLAWRDEPIRDRLAQRLGLPVVLDNDAKAAAWAEFRFGAGRDESRLLLVTLGTGIGGALVIDGRVERGRHGLAGEFGHMQVVPEGERCECGNRGCWEQYSSGRAMQREAREMLEQDSPYAAGLAAYCDGDPARVEGHHVTQAARAGDVAALELMGDVGRWLGVGLANLAAALDPGRIVVGGGVSEAGDLLLEPAREMFGRRLTGRGHRPVAPILAAELGPLAGMIGAADLVRVEAGQHSEATRLGTGRG